MKKFLATLALVGCLAYLIPSSAEAGIFGSRRVVSRSRVVSVRQPVVVRQRAAVIVPRQTIVAPAIVAPAVVAPAVVVPSQQILIAPY